MSDPAGIIDTGDPRDLANVVHRRQAELDAAAESSDDDATAEAQRRLDVAIRQAAQASVSVGHVDNDVDLDEVVQRRQQAYDDDPTDENRRRLDVALAQQEQG